MQNRVKFTADKCGSCTYHVEKEAMKQKKMLLDVSIELGLDIMGKSLLQQTIS